MVGVPLPVLLLGVTFSVLGQNAPSSFSINSPRSGQPSSELAEEEGPSRDVLVKLPDDLEAVLNLQNQDRSRIHASILGLPAHTINGDSPTSIDDILRDRAPSPLTSSTTSTPKSRLVSARPTSAPATPPAPVERVSPPVVSATRAPARSPAPAQPVERSFWAIAWEAHIYFSGTLFVLLSVYCFVNILRLHTFSRLFSRGYFIALNVSIMVIGVLRPIFLFHDPYNLGQTWPRMVGYLLLDLGYPCITTAFAVLFLALLRATQVRRDDKIPSKLEIRQFERPFSVQIIYQGATKAFKYQKTLLNSCINSSSVD